MHQLLKRISFDCHANYISQKQKGSGWVLLNLFSALPLCMICGQTSEEQVLEERLSQAKSQRQKLMQLLKTYELKMEQSCRVGKVIISVMWK